MESIADFDDDSVPVIPTSKPPAGEMAVRILLKKNSFFVLKPTCAATIEEHQQ